MHHRLLVHGLQTLGKWDYTRIHFDPNFSAISEQLLPSKTSLQLQNKFKNVLQRGCDREKVTDPNEIKLVEVRFVLLVNLLGWFFFFEGDYLEQRLLRKMPL